MKSKTCGLAALSAAVFVVACGLGAPPVSAQELTVPKASQETFAAGLDEVFTPDRADTREGFSLRNVPAFPGVTAGCQLWGTTAYVTGPAWRRADNFKPLANSTINGVAWSGYYRLVNAQTPGTSPGGETFEIRILSDNGGVPGAVHAGPFTVTPTSTPDGTFGTGGPQVYDYVATLPTGVAVTGGDCYWLEISNTNTGGQRWYWYASTANPGDTITYATGVQDPTYSDYKQVTADLAFCLDIELDSLFANPCPIVSVPAACANPDANGQPRAGATSGFSSNLPGSMTLTTGGSSVSFERAEAFKLTNSGDITDVCFYAFWNSFGTAGGGAVGGGFPGNPDLQVTYYNNDHPSGLLPGSILAQYTVGQPGVSIRFDTTGIHRIDHPPVHVNANECYYISISYLSNVNDASHHARFIWGFSNSTAANVDGYVYSRTVTTSPVGDWGFTATGTTARGLSFLFNVGDSVFPCSPAPATNTTCATATPLTIGGPVILGNNLGVASTVLPPCQFDVMFGPIVWYTLVGDGNTVTVSTCTNDRIGNPLMSVYCAASCAGPFNCVIGNNDLGAACSSGALAAGVTFPTVSGATYYIAMAGAGGGATVFGISATSDGVPANPPAGDCASFTRCENSGLPFDAFEPDPCSVSTATNTNATCATANIYPAFGMTVGGRVSTYVNGTTNTRDFDFWRLPDVAVPTIVTWKINSEFPTLYQFQRFAVDCTSIATVPAGATRTACFDQFLGEVTLQPGGINLVLITVPDFQGLPCPDFNDYRLTVSLVPTGTCCVPASVCFVTTQSDCDTQLGEFTANATCDPDPCIVVPTGACCAGTGCSVVEQSNCTGANTRYAGDATTCNAPGNNTTPCCKADFNQSGVISVQDIFDFLAAYFTGNPLADINSSGAVTVQDIFDFLGAYFSGCI